MRVSTRGDWGFPAADIVNSRPFGREGIIFSQGVGGMGRGRAPCCDKTKVKRGPWSPSEDLRLISFIQKFGHDNWRSLPKQAGLLRCGKSCRLRWINYLRPDVKRGNFTKEEEDTIISLHQSIGNKWSWIAAHLPGRTDNEIKNIWNTYLKKRLASPPIETSSAASASPSPSSSSSSTQFVDKVDDPMSQNIVGMAAVGEPLPPPCQSQDGSLKLDLSTSSGSSVSAQESDFSHNFDQLEKDPDPGDALFDLLGPKPEDTLEEVDKPNCLVGNNAMEMEIPLEFDYDFWNLFDNLDPLQTHLDRLDIQPTTSDVEACGVNLWGEDIQYEGEIAVENRNWLRRLERELGLEVAGEDSDMGFPSDL